MEQRYPYTLALTLAAMLIGIGISVPAGVFSALHRGRWPDRLLGVVSLGGLSFQDRAGADSDTDLLDRTGMAARVGRRNGAVLWVVVSVVFLLIHLVPGDPIVQMLGEGATASDVSVLRHAYGLDAPLGTQYLRYWHGVLHANLGESLRLHDSVTHLVSQRYPYTLALTLAALLIGIAVSVPAGVFSALHRGRWPDRVLGVVSLGGLSFPNFALGPILILIFSIQLGWLPVSGAGTGPNLRAALLALPDPAGDHAGQRTGRSADPHGAHGDAGRAGAGLHSHGAGQGPERARRWYTGTRWAMR